MKKLFCTILIAISILSCDQPDRNCKDYKIGTFSFDYIVDGEEKTGKFTRDENFSIEYYDNKIDSSAVKWVNDCEFVLKDIKSKTSVHMKILSTTDNSYTFEYSLVGDVKKIRGTAIITK